MKTSLFISNFLLKAFCGIFFLSLSVDPLFAECKCGKGKSVDEVFTASDVVVLGQVVSVAKANILHEGYQVAKIAITAPYKGVEILPATELITIFSKLDACGSNFVALSDYLIFAKGDPAFLTTSVCQLTDVQEKSRDKQVRVDALSKQLHQ